jgi:hypothetical protein
MVYFDIPDLVGGGVYALQVQALNVEPVVGLGDKTSSAYTTTINEYTPTGFFWRDSGATGDKAKTGASVKALVVGSDPDAAVNAGSAVIENVLAVGNALTIAGDPVADHVIEEGTSGIWRYRKYASGFAECWGTYSTGTVNVSTAWGGLYTSYTSSLPTLSFPFTFATAPYLQVTPKVGGANYWLSSRAEDGSLSTTQTGAFQAVRPTTSAITLAANYYAAGMLAT